ncbi:CsbA family protein [Metabacillus sp. GX 13764]|uniref:CsbA family protein n=1 Tax=Metabacillus kandeliae TaxID=2900151 RepID=UPI001E302266|nr:CsbA family protein [Metabacillus kandeliae]
MWKMIACLTLPFILVVLFTRVTYNHYIGTLLTVALLIVSYYKGYSNTWGVTFLDLASLIAGFLYARRMREKAETS